MINPIETLYRLNIISSWYHVEFFYSFFGRGLTHNDSHKRNESGKFPPSTIHHFHIDHNAPCLHRRVLHNHCFQYLLGITVVPGQIEDEGYAELLWVNNVHLGLYENGEFRTTGSPCGGRTIVSRHARTGFKVTFLSHHLLLYLLLGKRNIPYSHLTNCSVEVSAIA